jgi:hypothetical protein
MRWLFTLLAALALACNVSAHYIFIKFQKFDQYQYIRKNTNNNSPVTGKVFLREAFGEVHVLTVVDLASNDLRCNVGGASGATTDVLPMKAGDSFTFTSDQVSCGTCNPGRPFGIQKADGWQLGCLSQRTCFSVSYSIRIFDQ